MVLLVLPLSYPLEYNSRMQTDSTLKVALEAYPESFASWVLGKKVIHATLEDRELIEQPRAYAVDSLLRVTLEDNSQHYLHLEFQGKRSHLPMPIRMLYYLALICQRHQRLDLPLTMVVIYVGQGAGVHDTGRHVIGQSEIAHIDYRVIRLWEHKASEWLEHDDPILMSLLGQTKLENPEAELQQAFAKIRQLEDKEEQKRLVNIMALLLPREDLVQRMEVMAQDYGLLMDTPFVQKLRREGIEQGMQQGTEATLRKNTANILNLRFNPSPVTLQPIVEKLEQLHGDTLERVFSQAVTTNTLAEFRAWLEC